METLERHFLVPSIYAIQFLFFEYRENERGRHQRGIKEVMSTNMMKDSHCFYYNLNRKNESKELTRQYEMKGW